MDNYGRETLDLVIRDPELGNGLVLASVPGPDPDDIYLKGLMNLREGEFLEGIEVELRLSGQVKGAELRVDEANAEARIFEGKEAISDPIEDYRSERLLGERYELHSGRVAVDGDSGRAVYDAFALTDPVPLLAVGGMLIGACFLYQGARLAFAYRAAHAHGRKAKLVIKGGPSLSLKHVDCKLDTYIEEQ
jgi:hypothetical protein